MNYYPILFIRLGAGLLMFFFGLHQFKNPKPWAEEYIPGWIRAILGNFLESIMRFHALINILVGAALLGGFRMEITSWVAWIWMLGILPFAFFRSWKTGLRDLAINLSLLALIFLLK